MAESSQGRKKLVLVDGSGYIFRAYHALPPLNRPDGTPVNAVFGFCNMLTKLLRDGLHADYMAVIFDAARENFRNEIYADYKANRPDAPEDLIPQFPLIREATVAFGLPAIEMKGYEADDLIATYARLATEQGWETVIVSSDKDLMQLIDDHVGMLDPMKNKPIGLEQVKEKFGVTPDKVIEVQALIGDSTDNVPGVPGIGPKTAAELIAQYGSLEELLGRTEEIKQPKRRESLQAFAEQARISYKLVQLEKQVPVEHGIDSFVVREANENELVNFLTEQGFTKLLTRLGHSPAEVKDKQDAPTKPAEVKAQYELVQNVKALEKWISKAKSQGYVAFDTETTSLDGRSATLVGVSLATEAGQACYVPINHVGAGENQGQLFDDNSSKRLDGQVSEEDAIKLLKPLLEDVSVLKIGQNIKYDALVMKRYGVEIHPVEDTMLLSYVLEGGLHGHGMDELAELHLGYKPIAFKEVVGTGKAQKTFAEVELEPARDYAAEDADITLRLHQILKPQLISGKMVNVYESIERPLIDVIARMEHAGICVDPDKLRQLSNQFGTDMAKLEEEIHKLAGQPFNIGSPKQLGEILFDVMGLEGGKKSSKTGAYSTGAEVLEELAAQGHELPEKVLKWRGLSKLKSTYTDALLHRINSETKRVHTSYSMVGAATGRLSSSEPNLQNIPIRTAEGRMVREAFVSQPGYQLISADYSQIELRLLAEIAEIDVLRQAFKDGADIHATTASQMFGVPKEEVDSELRRKAKTINFGIIYGISAHGLAMRLGIGRGEAAEYINAYFEQYPGIRNYMEHTKEYARKHGYVQTLYGRKVHIKDIGAKNPNMRAFSERAAINAPLQGTAADIIKKAMLDVDRLITERYTDAKLLLQVHDELVLEAPEAKAAEVAEAVKRAMQQVVHLSIPLLVETGIGGNWGEIH